MKIRNVIFRIIFLFITTHGFAESIEDFFTSSPEHVVRLSESQDFLIGDIIHPLSGQPCLRQTDFIAKGAQNIGFTRIFIPNYTPLNELNGQIHPSKNSYAGWVHFPHTHLNVFIKGKIKGGRNNISETIVSVVDSNGVALSYQIDRHGKSKLKSHAWGISNGIGDHPSGKYDPRNVVIQLDGSNVFLQAPDGTKRYYRSTDRCRLSSNKDTYQCYYCILMKEVLPNGKVLRYQYSKERQVIKVESLDPNELHVYASIEIDGSFFDNRMVCKTHTGLEASYQHNTSKYFKQNEYGRYVDLLYPLRFTNISSPFFRNETITYQKDNKDNPWLKEYHGRHPIFQCHYTQKSKRKNDLSFVSKLFLLGNTEKFHPIYSMEYLSGEPGQQKSTTKVFHVDGLKTVYKFYANMLPEKISYFDEKDNLVKEKEFQWNQNQWLESIRLLDGQGQILSEKAFKYDSFGNPISEILRGDLTGSGKCESNEITRIFSSDGFNLLLQEELSNGKITTYTYIPETNLMTSCLVKEKEGACLTREFHQYDSCNNLIKIIEDNGSENKAEDLTNVSQRKITHYILRQESPFLHMPETIEVRYLENGIEKLLTRKKLDYDPDGNVAKEHVYDSAGNFAYTIEKEYDEQGNLLSETNAIGQKATYSYDAYGKREVSTNFSKNLNLFHRYDPKGRLSAMKEQGCDGNSRDYSFTYDHKDRLIQEIDSYKQVTDYTYDLVADKPIQIQKPQLFDLEGTPLSVIEKASYDALGRKLNSVDANGNSTCYRYNIYNSN